MSRSGRKGRERGVSESNGFRYGRCQVADAGRFAVSDRRTEAVYGGAAVLYAAGWEVKGEWECWK